jgi:hypothetical protein
MGLALAALGSFFAAFDQADVRHVSRRGPATCCGYIGCRYIGLRSSLPCVTDTGIAGDVTGRTAHPRSAAAAEGAGAWRPRRRRPPQGVLALALALVVAIGGLIAIVTFLAPLASAAGGCGGG